MNLDRLTTRITLAYGDHEKPGPEMCIMEAEAWIAGETHTDKPQCVCPVLGQAARSINDLMKQKERNELLAPMLGQFAGTRGTTEHERIRGFIAADYAARKFEPIHLRALGLVEDAVRLESLRPVVNEETARAAFATAYATTYTAAAHAANAAAFATSSTTYATAAGYAAYAAHAAASVSYAAADRRRIWELAVQMLKDMIAVHSTAPKEWARSPETLPCLMEVKPC